MKFKFPVALFFVAALWLPGCASPPKIEQPVVTNDDVLDNYAVMRKHFPDELTALTHKAWVAEREARELRKTKKDFKQERRRTLER